MATAEPPVVEMCLACKATPIEYETGTCHHPVFCKRCAMKCASGGKCKVCGNMYADLRRVVKVPPPAPE